MTEEISMRRKLVLVIALIVLGAPLMFSQSTDPGRPSFEVATIKPNNPDGRQMMITRPGGRLSIAGATVRMLVAAAYRVRDFQVIGGPNWINTDRFDIEAKAEDGANIRYGQTGLLMMQNLLADRFQLKTHRETGELPLYELIVAKDGAKLQSVPEPERPGPNAPPPALPVPGAKLPPGTLWSQRRGELVGSAVTLANFVPWLSQTLGRTIVDKTGLTGFFDLTLRWAPDSVQPAEPFGASPDTPPPADPAGPSIFTALQEQLGLRLESSKGPVQVIVIDSVEAPSEN